jgi:hypothetical protein
MDPLPPPLAFFFLLFAGWVNRQQQAMIDYLLEENRVLRAAQGSRRLRLWVSNSPSKRVPGLAVRWTQYRRSSRFRSWQAGPSGLGRIRQRTAGWT